MICRHRNRRKRYREHAIATKRAHLPANQGDPMASSIPDSPDALLRRDATAAALTAAGYKTAPGTLATKATRGGGPPYRLFGRIPLYRWGDAVAWAESRLSKPVRNTSEAGVSAAA